MRLKLPKDLIFESVCIFPCGEEYLILAEEAQLLNLLDHMPVMIGVGKRFSSYVRRSMYILNVEGGYLEIPSIFERYLHEDSAVIIETRKFEKTYFRIYSASNTKRYLEVHDLQCTVYKCEIER